MFQIVCALALDVPEVLHELERLWGIPPNVQLSCEPWGHINHEDNHCICLSSDHMGAYIHGLSAVLPSRDSVSAPLLPLDAASAGLSHVPVFRVILVILGPCIPWAYGRFLLATYVRQQTEFVSACDWLQPVTQGGGGLVRGSANRCQGTG